MLNQGECPETSVILAFHLGNLEPLQIDEIANHLEFCSVCEATLTHYETKIFEDLERLKLATKPNSQTQVLRIGPYHLISELGRGGMGVVWLAEDDRLQRPVAVKLLRTSQADGPQQRLRFRREAELASGLAHPNAVVVYDVGDIPDSDGGLTPYCVMEYLPGGSLARKTAERPVEPRRVAEWMEPICRAVAAAHAEGIIHRDIKPANILLTTDNRPKLCDFGIAKRFDQEFQVELTDSGFLMGTVEFMSPEQVGANQNPVGPASDIYGLGATLYVLLTGRPPFRGVGVAETFRLIQHAEAISPRKLQPGIPEDLNTITLKCLEKAPEHRYATAAALADDLRAYLEGRPIAARPIGTTLWAARWCRRNPLPAFLTMALIASLLFGLFGIGQQWRSAIAARQQAENASNESAHRTAVARLSRGISLAEQGLIDEGLQEMLQAGRELPTTDSNRLATIVRKNLAGWSRWVHRPCFDLPMAAQAITFSPDGRSIAVAERDRIHFLSADDGRELAPSLAVPFAVSELAWSPQNLLVVLSDGAPRLFRWNTITKLGQTSPCMAATKTWLAPDGTMMVARAANGELVWTEISETASVERHREKLATSMEDATWSACSKWFLIRCGTTLECRNRANFARQGLPIPNSIPGALGFRISSDGRIVATLHNDRTVRLWDATTGLPRGLPLSFSHATVGAVFSPDGLALAVATLNGEISWWDANTGTPLTGTISRPAVRGGRLLIDARATRLVAFGSEEYGLARCWELGPMPTRPRRSVAAGPRWAAQIGDSLDWAHFSIGRAISENRFVLADDGSRTPFGEFRPSMGLARIFDGSSGQMSGRMLRHPFAVVSVTCRSPDQRKIATASRLPHLVDAAVQQWDSTTAKSLGSIIQHRNWIAAMSYTPDGRELVSAGYDSLVYFHHAETGRPSRPPIQASRIVVGLAISPDGRTLATGLTDGTTPQPSELRLWRMSDGALLAKGIDGPILRLNFTADGRYLYGVNHAKTVKVFHCESSESVRPGPDFPAGVVNLARVTDDGRFLWTGNVAGVLRRWSIETGRPVGPAMTRPSPVTSLAILPDGLSIAVGYADGAVGYRDIETGLPLGPDCQGETPVTSLEVLQDGSGVIALGSGGIAFDVPKPEQLSGSLDELEAYIERVSGLVRTTEDAIEPPLVWKAQSQPDRPRSSARWARWAEEHHLSLAAEFYLSRLLEDEPADRADVHLRRAIANTNLHRDAAASQDHAAVAGLSVERRAGLLEAAALERIVARDFAAASKHLEHWSAIQPADGDPWAFRTQVALQEGNLQEAQKASERAIMLQASAMALTFPAAAAAERGNFDFAAKLFVQAVRQEPEAVQPHLAALFVLRANEGELYSQICLRSHAKRENLLTSLNSVAWMCSLGQQNRVDLQPYANMFAAILPSLTPEVFEGFANTYSLVLLRLNRAPESLKLNEDILNSVRKRTGSADAVDPLDWAIQSLAAANLGDKMLARTALAQAEAKLKASPQLSWQDRLETEILIAEARKISPP
jgi:eukaryotic-like serine/threonine-protein kinase